MAIDLPRRQMFVSDRIDGWVVSVMTVVSDTGSIYENSVVWTVMVGVVRNRWTYIDPSGSLIGVGAWLHRWTYRTMAWNGQRTNVRRAYIDVCVDGS